MKYALSLLALALAAAQAPAHAADGTTQASAWPPKISFADGTELSLGGNLQYDFNQFSGEGYNGAVLEDDDAWRRQELGFTLRRKGVYDLGVTYDFHAKSWNDVALRVETKALFGRDLGKVRIGQMKVPLGFEGNTATRAVSFLEASLPTQAFYENRRSGIDWAFERNRYLVNAGYFFESDLLGNNKGDTTAVRMAWTPRKAAGDVLHLGIAGSRERPDSEVNGLGVTVHPSVSWRARPEAALTSVRLVDSGTLTRVDRIDRAGLEALWIHGPWSVQGEYLRQKTTRDLGLPSYSADGGYVFASWMVTGESRGYSGGNVANPKPKAAHGAVELLARYSRIDLDSDGIAGGRQSDWTLGANWYLTPYFKFQANYVKSDATRGASSADPSVFELRAQMHF
ncbi:OprO/OprP family phosphate-selective porin [Pseudoxanthomonas mexicana]